MIVIKDFDFEMEQVKNTPFFDLKVQTVINAGKEKERTEMKLVGHGMPFETCIEHIVSYKLGTLDETFSIKEYIAKHTEIVNSILELVQFEEDKKQEDTEEENIDDLHE